MSGRNRWDEQGPPPSDAPLPPAAAQLEAAERAAAIAAKLSSQLGVRPPPSEPTNQPPPPPPRKEGAVFDGDFTHDIEINDLRNRYLLTKGSTQQAVRSSSFPFLDLELCRSSLVAQLALSLCSVTWADLLLPFCSSTPRRELPSRLRESGFPISQRQRLLNLPSTCTSPP